MITITKEFAYQCANAMVYEHNDRFERLSAAGQYMSFKNLYFSLKALECDFLIASAKGEKEIRDLVFNWSAEKAQAFLKNHHIK